MAARHFAQGDWEPETLQGEDDDELTEGSARHGRHLRQPEAMYEPPEKVSSFVVPVPENAEADARARARIEEIMAELDALMRAEAEPEPEPEPEPATDPEVEPMSEPAEEDEPAQEAGADSADDDSLAVDRARDSELAEEPSQEFEPQSQPVPVAPEPELASVSTLEAVPELEPVSTLDAVPALEPAPAPGFVDEVGMLDEPLFDDLDEALDPSFAWEVEQLTVAAQEAAATDASSQTNADEDLDATAKLDRVAERLAAEVVDDETTHGQSAALDRDRLEVATDLSVPKSVPKTSTTLVPVKRRLGFFAAIGAFIARLFHMDDR